MLYINRILIASITTTRSEQILSRLNLANGSEHQNLFVYKFRTKN